MCNDHSALTHELRKSHLLTLALQAENKALRQSLAREQSAVSSMKTTIYSMETAISSMENTISMMSVPYYRYIKLAKMIPHPIKKIISKIYKLAKG